MKFGNCWKNGEVTLYQNGVKLKTVGDFGDAAVEFEYEDGNEIKITATGYAILFFQDFKEFLCEEVENFCGGDAKTGKQFRGHP